MEHEIIKTLTDIKLQNTDNKLNKKNICSNIIKTEMQLYEREVVILLKIVLNFKSKPIIKGAIVKIERKLGKFYVNQIFQKTAM